MHDKTKFFINELAKMADVVNSLRSETTQLKVIDDIFLRLEHQFNTLPSSQTQTTRISTTRDSAASESVIKKTGSTVIIKHLLETSFFTVPKSIRDIKAACYQYDGSVFRSNQISGVLSRMANQNLLQRHVDPDRRLFVYVKAQKKNSQSA